MGCAQGCANVRDDQVKLVMGIDGRPTGEAFVEIAGPGANLALALAKDRQVMPVRFAPNSPIWKLWMQPRPGIGQGQPSHTGALCALEPLRPCVKDCSPIAPLKRCVALACDDARLQLHQALRCNGTLYSAPEQGAAVVQVDT